MEKKFTLNELKKVINLLEQNKVDYYVFGGFALDAISKIERKHGDLDLIVNYEQREQLTNLLSDLGYKKRNSGRLVVFEILNQNSLFYSIGTLWMKSFNHFYKIRGNRVEDILSKKDFNKQNYVNINDIEFRIMPFEWFSLYKDIIHWSEKKDVYHKKAIQMMLPFCKEVKILEQKPIKRLKSDPYYKD